MPANSTPASRTTAILKFKDFKVPFSLLVKVFTANSTLRRLLYNFISVNKATSIETKTAVRTVLEQFSIIIQPSIPQQKRNMKL